MFPIRTSKTNRHHRIAAAGLLVALLFFLFGSRAAAEALSTCQIDGVTKLAPYLSYAIDPEGTLELDDILRGDGVEFKKINKTIPSFGYIRDALWMRFDVRNLEPETRRLTAVLESARMDHFDWMIVDGEEVLQRIVTGVSDPGRIKTYRFPRVEFEIPPGQSRTIYLRSQSRTAQILSLKIGLKQAIDRDISMQMMSDFTLIGFCFAVVVFALVFSALHRQQFYLFLGAFAFTYLAYFTIFSGYLRWVFMDIPLWIEREFFGVMCGLSVLVFTQFNASMLELYRSTRRVRIFQGLADTAAVFTVGIFLIFDFSFAIRWFGLVQAIAYICGSISMLAQPKDSNVSRAPLMLTWFSWGSFVILLTLQFLAKTPITVPVILIQQLFVPVILASFFLSVLRHQKSIDEIKLGFEKSKRAETTARLSALRYQINPHFLFNTLTSIDALSRLAPAKIPELVGKLATFLRLRLVDTDNGLSSLRQEIESVRAYLEIEQLRFGDALQARYDIEPASLNLMVPEMILQPLVENVVKYGFDEDRDVEVRITSTMVNGKLLITVANPGELQPAREETSGMGIGTENTRARLRLFFGNRASFSLTQQGKWVVATIEIPESTQP